MCLASTYASNGTHAPRQSLPAGQSYAPTAQTQPAHRLPFVPAVPTSEHRVSDPHSAIFVPMTSTRRTSAIRLATTVRSTLHAARRWVTLNLLGGALIPHGRSRKKQLQSRIRWSLESG